MFSDTDDERTGKGDAEQHQGHGKGPTGPRPVYLEADKLPPTGNLHAAPRDVSAPAYMPDGTGLEWTTTTMGRPVIFAEEGAVATSLMQG